MIRVRRLNLEPFMINADMIESVEETPDTVVTMLSGRKFVVTESSEEIRDRVIDYRRSFVAGEQFHLNRGLPSRPNRDDVLE